MQSPNGSFVKVHTTETIMKTLHPTWRPFGLTLIQLCNGDMARKLLFKCYDWDSDGRNDLIGKSR
jgi:Ca2+-dependent lipid-binding protein